MKELTTIQLRLNAPKGETNRFGGYQYRTCESILRSLKPLMEETGTNVVLTDDLVLIGDRVYVKATATLTNAAGETVCARAFAREAQGKKGMDEAQVTGGASSYARKYALCGLLAIDGANDPDRTNCGAPRGNEEATPAHGADAPSGTEADAGTPAAPTVNAEAVARRIMAVGSRGEFEARMHEYVAWWQDEVVKQAMAAMAKKFPRR